MFECNGSKVHRLFIKTLDWLDAPARYIQVRFECDDESVGPGLDDIVVERSDGLFDLQQVKFTPAPDIHTLCWNWMLEKPARRRDRGRCCASGSMPSRR